MVGNWDFHAPILIPDSCSQTCLLSDATKLEVKEGGKCPQVQGYDYRTPVIGSMSSTTMSNFLDHGSWDYTNITTANGGVRNKSPVDVRRLSWTPSKARCRCPSHTTSLGRAELTCSRQLLPCLNWSPSTVAQHYPVARCY